jgi:hypothetical protein
MAWLGLRMNPLTIRSGGEKNFFRSAGSASSLSKQRLARRKPAITLVRDSSATVEELSQGALWEFAPSVVIQGTKR